MMPFSAGIAVGDCREKKTQSISSCQPHRFPQGPNRLLERCRQSRAFHKQVELPWSTERPQHSTPLLWHPEPVTLSRKLPPLQLVNPCLNQQRPQPMYPLPNPHLLLNHLSGRHTVPNL